MRKIISLLLLILTTGSINAQNVVQDGSYRIGKLSNGLTYYIRHNAKDKGLADLYIAQRVGSILEEPRQRGLAHFLEHMAFNGTKNFPGDSTGMGIVPWCETKGIKFGANLNAYTSVDQTVYNIKSAPVSQENVLDSALLILHDWSHYLLLTDKEIDKERGVIHEEWRTRSAKMATQRMMERVMPTVYKGTKYEDCLPIGNMDIVDNFPYEDLRDYYRKWYRPDLQAVIVVGDVDVDKVEKKIQDLFSDIPMPENAAQRIYYPVTDNDEMIVAMDKDSEQPIMLAHLYMKRDATPDSEKQSIEYQRGAYISRLVSSMIMERYQELQHLDNPPCLSATARDGSFFVSRTKDAFSISFGCRQDDIKKSVEAAVGIAEQARQHGFTQEELSRAKSLFMNSVERKYAERNDRRNGYYVRQILQNFMDYEPLTSEEYDLQLVKDFDKNVTLDDINKGTKNIISDKNQVLVIFSPDKKDFKIPSKEDFVAYVTEAQQKTYDPYKEEVLPSSLLSSMPKAGHIKSEKQTDKFGFKQYVLDNGVTVYVKPTDFAKDQIQMRLWGDGGKQYFPADDRVNFAFIQTASSKCGVSDFSETTLSKMLTGKVARVNPFIGSRTQGINGSSSVKDMETMLQLAYLYFTSPRKDTTAFNGELRRMSSFLTNRDANPNVAYNDSLMKICYGDNPRVQPLKKEDLSAVSYDRVLDIYRQSFHDANGFNMLIIGNVDSINVRQLLCQYIASLPSSAKDAVNKVEKLQRDETYELPQIVDGNFTKTFKKKMNTPSALVNIFYTFDEPIDLKTDLTLDILKRVLSIAYTDSVREEKGGTYGVSVSYSLDKDDVPTALMKINFRTDPAKYDTLIPIVYKQVENIANNGPIASDMDKVKKYLSKSYHQNVIYNDYWNYVMYNYVSDGVDYHTGYLDLLDKVSADDVKKVAQDLLKSNRRIEVTMISE